MRAIAIPVVGLTLMLAVLTACSGTASTPTSTPSPAREWNLEEIKVDGSTVTVLLNAFAGIDVRVKLGDREPDEVVAPPPSLAFVFRDVDPGRHTIGIRDGVGFEQTEQVVVPALTATPTPGDPSVVNRGQGDQPAWLTDLIQRLKSEPVASPPSLVAEYEYEGQTVYFVPQRCCDIFSDLYDADGEIIGHPDGGIGGRGDGRASGFFETRRNESVVWRDERSYDPALTQATAPIESVDVLVLEIFPPQYLLTVVSGLPNACFSYAGYRLTRSGTTIQVEMTNWKPSDSDVVCAEIYRTVQTSVSLGSDFASGTTFTVVVNDVKETFVAQ